MRTCARWRLAALQREANFAALRHRRAGAANRVGSIEIRRRIGEGGRIDRSRLSEVFPLRASYPIGLGEDWMSLPHALTQFAERIERQGMAEGIRQSPENPPI